MAPEVHGIEWVPAVAPEVGDSGSGLRSGSGYVLAGSSAPRIGDSRNYTAPKVGIVGKGSACETKVGSDFLRKCTRVTSLSFSRIEAVM